MNSKNIADFLNLVKADMNTIFWCKTYEPDRFINDFLMAIRDDVSNSKFDMNGIFVWDAASGLSTFNNASGTFISLSLTASEIYRKTINPKGLLDNIAEEQMNLMTTLPIYILKNFHMFNRASVAPNVVQGLLNLRQPGNFYQQLPVIIVSPIVDIPEEESKLFTVFEYELPSESQIKDLVGNVVNQLKNKNIIVSDNDMKTIVSSAKGLTYNEINNCSRKSIAIKKTLDPDFFKKEKVEIVKQSGCLDFKETNSLTINDMGGNDEFKKWLLEEKELFEPEAKDFGLELPKGYICFGPPGSGKSASAEITANLLGVPLLELNFSKIMGSLVGQSERAIDKALSIAKATAPCVLLLDECEKVLGGYVSSQSSDSGTLSRVLSRLLTFMQDNNSGVFVIMTSNDITKLPPELMRSGRFETQWYFGLPDSEERESIISLYLNKKDKKLSSSLMKYLVDKTQNFTGAELKNTISIMLRKLYLRYKKDKSIETSKFTEEDIDQAVLEIVPVYKYAYDTILELQQYAKTRARFASKNEKLSHDIINNLTNTISI